MRYVKLTNDQANKINSNKIGFTSGRRNKETGIRPNIKFCSSLDFVSVFGYDVEREFIEI
tara:strand:+ start:134 stop:313 length:180 start_codon:yes stop_codon:yes gene_type:complete